MPRTGVERKPAWHEVPPGVREEVASLLGSRVARALRVWGGYGPTPTYRLRLADGRRAFFKGVNPDSNEFATAALVREERVYRELGRLVSRWAPRFLSAFRRDGWHVLLLEDLGRSSAPPWPRGLPRRVLHSYADFHRSTAGRRLPRWLPTLDRSLPPRSWLWTWAEENGALRAVARLAAAATESAERWLEAALPTLARASRSLTGDTGTPALLHGDTRSDNLRWTRGRLYLLDWPAAVVGPPELDLAAFAQSITVEGGPVPEALVRWYAERGPVREGLLDGAVATVASYFAHQARLPEPPELPRLRAIQRRQLGVTLAWAARRLGLPEPGWTAALMEP